MRRLALLLVLVTALSCAPAAARPFVAEAVRPAEHPFRAAAVARGPLREGAPAAKLADTPLLATGSSAEDAESVARLLSDASAASAHSLVTGRVTDVAGIPLEGVAVQILLARADRLVFAAPAVLTDSSGRYAVAVPPGTYRIQLTPGAAGYGTRWWPDARDLAAARDIAVGDAQVRSADAVVPPGRTVRGTVRERDDEPAIDTWVVAYSADGAFVGSTRTRGDGSYALRLADGEYVLAYLPDPVDGLDGAWVGPLTVGDDVPDLDVALEPLGID